MTYTQLLIEAEPIRVYETDMPRSIRGLYGDNVIWINRSLTTSIEKVCVLAEELGHYHTSSGDILDQTSVPNRKQEVRARRWAYERLTPLTHFVKAHQIGIRNRHELAHLFNITEEFLQEAIDYYIDKYGLSAPVGNYTVIFEPLGVLEMFDF